MAKTSPTQRTLKYIREQGYTCGIVERFLCYAGKFGKRVDLFGIIDIIAIKEYEMLGVQSCGTAFSEHDKKILESENSKEWIKAGGKLMLIGWRKVKKKRGGKAMGYKPRIKEYTLEDFA